MKKLICLLVCILLVGCTRPANSIDEVSTEVTIGAPATDEEHAEVEVRTAALDVSVEATPAEAEVEEDIRDVVSIDFSFVGDVMLADYKGQRKSNNFYSYYDKEGSEWFFDKVKHYFIEDDFTIANIENVFTDNENIAERDKDEDPGYWYKSKTMYATPLVGASIEVADLNNNHVGDYGVIGRDDTRKTLEDLGLLTGSYMRPCYFEKDNVVIGMVCAGLWNSYQAEQLTDIVKEVKSKCDVCIVFFHGGEMMIHEPDDYKVKGAHNAIDAGADLVVGCHPHCLQPSEVYNNKVIVYSLGNFCYGGSKKPENRTVIFKWNIQVDTDTKEIVAEGYSFIPCYVYSGQSNNYQSCPIGDVDEREAVIDFMYGLSSSPFGD